MPLLTAIRDIKQKKFAPVYVLYGTETFRKEELIKLMNQTMIDPDYADMNVGRYDCTEIALSEILVDADTVPFFSEHRLIIADNAYFLTGAKPPTKVEADTDALAAYIENPQPTTSLVFRIDADKLDERKKLVKSLQQRAVVINFEPLKDHDLSSWIERQAKQWDATITPEDAHLLAERVGSDLRLLYKEIEKMALYAGKGGRIDRQVIETLAARTLEQDVFGMVEDVVTGRVSDAFRTLYDMLKTGEEPIKLMALFIRQFRMLLHTKTLAAQSYSAQSIAGMIKAHPYAVKKAMEQARYFDEAGLRRLLGILAEEDFRMKTGQVDKRLALEMFITKVAQEKKR
ncbi:DNA polymerase III subunit delta [Brevibacillus dissolubilis]|uniref:DNA polymerase III subunit delta n=1 Tax=Brevibacillus dissolubilis TaxID=1844116 RepID=UPI0011160467|nr:DNA polymerase III subunit delta [Brevibacillus dissolubilis]